MGNEKSEHRPGPLTNLIEEFGTLSDNASAGADPGCDQHPLAIEWLCAHEAGLKPLRRDMLVDHVLTVGAAHHAAARHRQSILLLVGIRKDRDELADPQPGDIALNGKVDGDRLVAVGKAGTLIFESKTATRRAAWGCRLRTGECIETERFDPESLRIDNLEDD